MYVSYETTEHRHLNILQRTAYIVKVDGYAGGSTAIGRASFFGHVEN